MDEQQVMERVVIKVDAEEIIQAINVIPFISETESMPIISENEQVSMPLPNNRFIFNSVCLNGNCLTDLFNCCNHALSVIGFCFCECVASSCGACGACCSCCASC